MDLGTPCECVYVCYKYGFCLSVWSCSLNITLNFEWRSGVRRCHCPLLDTAKHLYKRVCPSGAPELRSLPFFSERAPGSRIVFRVHIRTCCSHIRLKSVLSFFLLTVNRRPIKYSIFDKLFTISVGICPFAIKCYTRLNTVLRVLFHLLSFGTEDDE